MLGEVRPGAGASEWIRVVVGSASVGGDHGVGEVAAMRSVFLIPGATSMGGGSAPACAARSAASTHSACSTSVRTSAGASANAAVKMAVSNAIARRSHGCSGPTYSANPLVRLASLQRARKARRLADGRFEAGRLQCSCSCGE